MNKVIYANIMGADVLSKNEKLFLSDLISYAHSTGYVFARNAHFAQLYGVTIRTVNRWLEKLKKLGLIRTKLERYPKSYIVKKRLIYVNMDNVSSLNDSALEATDTLISDSIQYDKDLPKSAKHMLAVLVKYSQLKGYVYASDDHFAKLFGVHRTTVARWIKTLEEIGVIEVSLDHFQRRIFICVIKKQAAKAIKSAHMLWNLCKNVMYSVTSIIQTRKKRLFTILSNLICNTERYFEKTKVDMDFIGYFLKYYIVADKILLDGGVLNDFIDSLVYVGY